MEHLTTVQIKDISNSLTDMERGIIVLVHRGVAWCGFTDRTDRLFQMGLLSNDNIRLSTNGERVFNALPHYQRY